MPGEFYDAVSHHLPPGQPVGPRGGRPRGPHRTVLKVIRYVPVTGCRRGDVPPETGCSGRTARRRPGGWGAPGIRDRLRVDLLRLLREHGEPDTDTVVVDASPHRAFGGGVDTGPGPVDRRKPDSKPTLMADGDGVPPVLGTAGANTSDHTRILPVPDGFPRVGGRPGRPKEAPDDLYADRGCDSDTARHPLRRMWSGRIPPGGTPDTAAGRAGAGGRSAGSGARGGRASGMAARGSPRTPGRRSPPR